jgi:putative ABC transport system ATP-binding protein
MIGVNNLTFSYGDRRSDVSSSFGMRVDAFEVRRGASTALVGPSGSGKTTLLGLIAGTLRPNSGNIRVDDQVITQFSDRELGNYRARNIGQVFQSFELLNYLSIIENVILPWYITGYGRRASALERARELLASVGLETRAGAHPGELSQGEQQRVAVCRAMFSNPALLLADEPTGNLDQENKQNVVDLLRDQARKNNSTLLMVTHDESLLGSFDAVYDMGSIAQPLDAKSP